MRLGETIRHYRLENKWTLKMLSEQCNLSVAQLSKLENNKSQPSIDALRRLASVFNIPISALTLTDVPPLVNPVFSGEGFIVRWCGKGPDNVTVRYLTLDRNAKMQPIVVTIPGLMDTGISRSHPGDEFFYVLKGNVRFYYGENEIFDMSLGDFLYYDGYIPHHWENIRKEEAQLLTCNTPPVM